MIDYSPDGVPMFKPTPIIDPKHPEEAIGLGVPVADAPNIVEILPFGANTKEAERKCLRLA